MRNHLLRLALASATCAAALGSTSAFAIDPGACCVQTTSRLETLLNPNKGSDENFFSAAGGPPNVMFLLGTNESMQEYPVPLPNGADGCSDAALTAGLANFDLASTDPERNGSVPIDADPGFSGSGIKFFDPAQYYTSRPEKLGLEGSDTVWSLDNNFRDTQGDTDRAAACGRYIWNSLGAASDCSSCLNSKGWYKGTTLAGNPRWVLSGRVLNVYPPKFVVARKVLKDAIDNVGNVRMGITIFGPNTGFYDAPTQIHPVKPNCNRAFPWDEGIGSGNSGGALRPDLRSQINAVAFTNDERSIGEALFGIGAYFSSERVDGRWTSWFSKTFSVPSNYPGASGWDDGTDMWLDGIAWESGGNQLSVCWACQQTAVVVLTDGAPFADNSVPQSRMMQILIDAGVRHADGTAVTFSANAGGSCPNTNSSGGVNYCDQFGATKCDCDSGGYPQGPDDGNKNFMDDVAFFIAHSDLRTDYPGMQNVRVYTIGYGDNSPMLQSIARAGEGLFFRADSATELSQAITTAVNDIINRATSFSSSAVAAVQTGSSSTPALLPRMLPKAGQPWQGKLWRFDQFNEFVEDADLNGDSDKEDIFIVDKPTGPLGLNNIVTEAQDGTFIKANQPTINAVPYWEGNGKLVADLDGGVANRLVWTVFDSNGDGAFTNADTTTRVQLGATEAEDLAFAEYMGLRRSVFCPTSPSLIGKLFEKFNLTMGQAQTATSFTLPGTPAQKDYDRLCARVMIMWIMGADMFDQDGDGNRREVRANVLGDIFHSSPVVVGPPVEPFLCNLGLSNQCARTLFAQDLSVTPTPAPAQSVATSACGITTLPPYEAYVFEQRRRQQVVLVGANDGMVHAFVSASYTGESCVGGQPVPTFDKGSGKEAWAFIPPDLLPKLPDLILNHEYMVDGDIMVRDIWADTGDGIKQKNEFHTLAVVSEGRGGKHYIALEVAYDSAGNLLNRPGFRWMFPQPCSEEAATFGKTFLSISPKPPAIGPVLIDDASLPGTSSMASAAPITRQGVDTHERWVVALSGGWSPALEKGRGIYVVDAWEGQINDRRDNLWWKFEFSESASGSNAPAKELVHSVSAPVAMIDYGSNEDPSQDGFFDTAVFGDTAGQLWVSRMYEPGRFDNSTKRINNWFTGRAYEMDRDGLPGAAGVSTLPDGGTEPVDPNAKSVANKHPFYYLPSAAIEPGVNKLRIFAGTGNRYSLLEKGPGSCRFDNPLACSKSNCDDVKTVSRYRDDVIEIGEAETHWKSRRFEHGKLSKNIRIAATATLNASNTCGSSGSVQVTAENHEYRVGTCDLTSGSDPSPGSVNRVEYECGLDSSGNSFLCRQNGSSTRSLSDLVDNSLVDLTGLGDNRFVGVWAYGGTQTDGGFRGFGGTSGITPQQYDQRRVSDRSTTNTNSGELIDVTSVGCGADQSCDGGATPNDFGWFFDYSTLEQKTASGGAVIASCVLWSDLSPSGGDGGVCSTSVTPLSRIYQADFITGQPNCAFGFLPLDGGAYARSQARTVVAPPPEPATVVQVSKTGEVRYSAMIVEPGKGQATSVNVSGGQDVLQVVYELPVSRSLHNCRHADGGCSTVP